MCQSMAKLEYGWSHLSAPVSLEWFPPSFKNRLKRIDLGKMMIDFVFFSNALAEPEVLASTECRWWMKTNVQGRPSWVMAGQQSAPVGLEWFPPSFKSRLKCIGLGNMMIDPAFFPNALVGPNVLVSKETRWWMKTHVQRDVEVGEVSKGCGSRRGAKGRLSWVMAGQQSAPVGLEWFPPSFKSRLKCIGLGKMMIDPVFFSNALVGPKVFVSTEWGW